jgi:excisionase family DNA binding protein
MSITTTSRTKLLTVDELADALGLSPKTIRQWIWMRRVAYVRVGRLIRFRPEIVDEIVNRGSVPALEARQ